MAAGVHATGYPVEEIGAFQCADGQLNAIWRTGVDMSRLLMQHGCPCRTRWGGFGSGRAKFRGAREAALAGKLSLCHNDPWHNNFLDDGTVRLLDWEFAGMGDPFFDLASVAGASLPEENAFLLECYFGAATPEDLQTLDEMLFVVVFWNATWALIQIGMADMEHDYGAMACGMFDFLEERL